MTRDTAALAAGLMAPWLLATSPSVHAEEAHGICPRQARTAPALPTTGETSPYAGEETRGVKALSDEEVRGYLEGRGLGLARAAELNHYPGPRHVLELADALGLTAAQADQTRRLHDAMHADAVRLGAELVEAERRLDAAFADGPLDEQRLASLVDEAARIQGRLRAAHLRAHVGMRRLLTAGQIARYDELRGYSVAR